MQAIDHAAQSLQNHYWCFDTLLKKKNKMQREFSEFNVKKKRLNCWQANILYSRKVAENGESNLWHSVKQD